jgi:hypothetical protein
MLLAGASTLRRDVCRRAATSCTPRPAVSARRAVISRLRTATSTRRAPTRQGTPGICPLPCPVRPAERATDAALARDRDERTPVQAGTWARAQAETPTGPFIAPEREGARSESERNRPGGESNRSDRQGTRCGSEGKRPGRESRRSGSQIKGSGGEGRGSGGGDLTCRRGAMESSSDARVNGRGARALGSAIQSRREAAPTRPPRPTRIRSGRGARRTRSIVLRRRERVSGEESSGGKPQPPTGTSQAGSARKAAPSASSGLLTPITPRPMTCV